MSRFILALAWGLSIVAVVAGEDLPAGTVDVTNRVIALPNGDVGLRRDVTFSPADYAEARTSLDPRRFIEEWATGPRFVAAGPAEVAYDDEHCCMRVSVAILGLARSADGRVWELEARAGDVFGSQGDLGEYPGFYFEAAGRVCEGRYASREITTTHAPKGATGAAWDDERRVMRWELPPPEGAGTDDVRVALRTRSQVPLAPDGRPADGWVARLVVRNAGGGYARAFTARCRVAGGADEPAWGEPCDVAPGQTVIVLLSTVIAGVGHWEGKAGEVEIRAEWKYLRSDGSEAEGTSTRRVTLAEGAPTEDEPTAHVDHPPAVPPVQPADPRRDPPAENVVPPAVPPADRKPVAAPEDAALDAMDLDDPGVQELVALAKERTRDVDPHAPGRDGRVLRVIYEILRERSYTCEPTPTLSDPALRTGSAFTWTRAWCGRTVERMAGNSIDLCYLLGAVCVGLDVKPMVALLPDHALFVAIDRAGEAIPLEIASETAPEAGPLLPYEMAAGAGRKAYFDARQAGRVSLSDLCPEMRRGLAGPGEGPTPGPGGDPAPGPGERPPRPTEPPAPDKRADPFVGEWTGSWEEPLGGGRSLQVVGAVKIGRGDDPSRFSVTFFGTDAATGTRVAGTAVGELQGDAMLFQERARHTLAAAGGGEKQSVGPCRGSAQVVDGKLVMTYGNDTDGFAEFTLERGK